MSLEIPFGIKTTNNVEVDAWGGPYADLAAARAAVPTSMRLYRTVKIIEGAGIQEYVWKNGTADGDLVVKLPSQADESNYGTTKYNNQTNIEAAADASDPTTVDNTTSTHLRGLKWFMNRIFATARTIVGVWSAPTASVGTNTGQIATTQFVQSQIGATIDTDGALAANSDAKVASQKATKTYVDNGLSGKQNSLGFTAEDTANKATDFSTLNNTKFPTTQAVENEIYANMYFSQTPTF